VGSWGMSGEPCPYPCVPVLVPRYRERSDGSWTALVSGGDPVAGINNIDLDDPQPHPSVGPGTGRVRRRIRRCAVGDEGLRTALNDALERLGQSRARAAALTPPPPLEPGQRFLSGSWTPNEPRPPNCATSRPSSHSPRRSHAALRRDHRQAERRGRQTVDPRHPINLHQRLLLGPARHSGGVSSPDA